MRFSKNLVVLSLTFVISGCSTAPKPTGGSRSLGLVEMSVIQPSIAPPIFNWAAAEERATAICKKWGYQDADPANSSVDFREGDKRECVTGVPALCAEWQVTLEYQCYY